MRTPVRVAWLVPPVVLAVTCWSCGGGDLPRYDPPQPPLDASEPPVAERIREATQAVRDDPASAGAWGRMGEIYDVHDFEEPALFCYDRAQELDPLEWRWPYFAGLLLRSSDPVSALDHFSHAAKLEPGYAALQFHLGFAHYLAESFGQADRHFERALALDPGCLNARLGLARVAVARGEPQAALSHLQQAGEAAAEEGALHVHLAQVYRELGRHAEAEREEQLTVANVRPARLDAMAVLPDRVRDEVRLREGVSSTRQLGNSRRYLREGREKQAAAAVRKALEADPRSVPALIASAQLLTRQGEFDPARAHLERALEIDEESAQAHVEIGTLDARSGRVEPAIGALERALEIDPKLYRVRSNLAGLYLRTGRGEEGLELLRDASLDRPGDADIHSKMATVLVELGRFEEAVQIFGKVARVEPGRAAEFGHSLWQQQRHAEAIRVYGQGLEAAPEDRMLNRLLAWSLATCPVERLRDGRRALTIARRLSEATSSSNPEFLDTLAAAQAATGDFPGAARNARRGLEILERVLRARPAAGMTGQQRHRLEELSKGLHARAALYSRGLPYREEE